MVPISLSIQGFYSYQQKQTIDFTRLTKAGVFGIFGATGSGKSAIIEAIVFALYGETERINNREDRSYNMMNLRSNELCIEFICSSDFTNTEYKITAFAKRSKQFEKVTKIERVCYKKIDSEWKPVESGIIQQEVTGLSYENFKRTVIIPQGKFMDFIQLTPTERTTMLKELFSLHKFELSENVKNIEGKALHNKTLLEGNLQEVGEIEETTIQELEEKEKKILEIGTALKTQNIELQNKVLLQANLIKDFEELEKLQKTYNELAVQKPAFDEIEKRIQNIDYCIKHFAPLFDKLLHKEEDLHNILKQITDLSQKLEIESKLFDTIEKQFESISKEFSQLPEYEKQTVAIESLIDCKKSEIIIKQIHITKDSANQLLNNSLKSIGNIEKEIHTKKLELQNQKNSLEDISTILKQRDELQTYQNILTQIEESRNERITIEKNIHNLQNKLLDTSNSIGCKKIESKDILEFINIQTQKTEQTIEEINIEIQRHKLQYEIAFLHTNLKSGNPCPVCGSIEHPSKNIQPLTHFDTNDLETKKKECLNFQKLLLTAQNSTEQIHNEIITEKKKDHVFSQKMHELTIKRNLNEPDFEIRDINFFAERILKYTQTNELIQTIDKELQLLQSKQTQFIHEKEISLKQVTEIENSLIEQTSRHNTLLEKIDSLLQEKFKNYTELELQNTIENRKIHTQTIAEQHQTISLCFQTKKDDIKNLEINIQTLKNRNKTTSEEVRILDENITFAINKSIFSSKKEIEELLSQKDSLLSLSQSLEKFKNSLILNENSIKILQEKLTNKTINKEEYTQLQTILEENEKQLRDSRDEYVRINEQLKTYRIKYQKRKELTSQIETCNHELENIGIMKSLFKQSGFVNYMSTRYMYMLCDIANKRFIKLTRHALQLEVADNTFCVRDFMNNGKIRHIKTLSGGQAFQAALSLALALSESIHNNTPIVSNFFFIDEGFGSQDKENLSTVFETLRSLQNEGKTVGIISHVEELKENIPIYLLVHNNEKGSIIN